MILTRTPGEVEVKGNVLIIKRLDKSRDEGMYQCEARNQHGTAKTSAQLRVLCKTNTLMVYQPNYYYYY